MSETAWAQERREKRKAWYEIKTANKKTDQLQQENAELKANLVLIADLAAKQNLPDVFHIAAKAKGSLEVHDLKVKESAIHQFMNIIHDHGELSGGDIAFLFEQSDEYIDNLIKHKEQ